MNNQGNPRNARGEYEHLADAETDEDFNLGALGKPQQT